MSSTASMLIDLSISLISRAHDGSATSSPLVNMVRTGLLLHLFPKPQSFKVVNGILCSIAALYCVNFAGNNFSKSNLGILCYICSNKFWFFWVSCVGDSDQALVFTSLVHRSLGCRL